MLEDQIRDHAGRVALQFSGGRDSLAMLLLLQPLWPQLTVYYLNSGDAYPETLALVERVRRAVPRFVEVAGRAPEVRERLGWPSDLATPGASWPFEGIPRFASADRYVCCLESIMRPLHERMVADGITLLLRGQRASDTFRGPARSGDTAGGVTVLHPIEQWSTEEVETYIAAHGWSLPPFYAEGATTASDCMHCTAWLEHNSLPYLERHHPRAAAAVHERLRAIRVAVEPHYERLARITEQQ